jgi:nucleotide-binding universal stress UspA family protein
MLPIRTILHPTDFSDRADCALRVACALARDYAARLVIVHVIPPPVAVYGEVVALPEPWEERHEVEDRLQRLAVPDAGIQLERRVCEGDPVTEILTSAADCHADLIVLGTHGRTGLGRLLMGSVAEEVLRRAACPVLTVRTPFPAAVPAREPAVATTL